MDKISEELVKKIEKVLDIKFYEWQRKYLLNEPMVLDLKITGRGTGKSLIYMIKKLFEDPKPLLLKRRIELLEFVDWWNWTDREECARFYPNLDVFKNELMDIYEKLNDAGIITRKVVF